MFRSIRLVGITIAVFAAGAGLAVCAAETPQGRAAITCSNPVSGVRWQIVIDYGNSTVDSYPAAITPSEISWVDPRDGGHNSIDRVSGELVTAVGSSTGGWLRHNNCNLEQSH